jgi:hypothetical protein
LTLHPFSTDDYFKAEISLMQPSRMRTEDNAHIDDSDKDLSVTGAVFQRAEGIDIPIKSTEAMQVNSTLACTGSCHPPVPHSFCLLSTMEPVMQ